MKLANKKYLILLILIFCVSITYGQQKKNRADKEFSNYNFALALDYYKDYLEKRTPDATTCLRIAECYRHINNSEKAAEWYQKAILLNVPDPDIHLKYGKVLVMNGEYLDAIDEFVKYGIKMPEQKDVSKNLSEAAYQALEWMSYPEQVKIINAEAFNSGKSDFSPVSYKGEIVFTSDRMDSSETYEQKELAGWTGNPYLKIYTLKEGKASLFSEAFASDYHTGPAAFSPSGDTVVFTKTFKVTNPVKLLKDREKAKSFINRLELWYAIKKDGEWQEAKAFPHNKKTEYSLGHACFSTDGKVLYFVSDMPGSIGKTDIYYSTIFDGKWGDPVNLGPKVNTEWKEVFPHITKGGYLYFSSDRPEGMGGLDLYKAKGNKTNWSLSENLRYPMNSSKDDFGLLMDSTGNSGYFSSNRLGGYGSDDIYEFRKPGCVLAGITLEKSKSGKELILENVQVELFRKGDTTELAGYARSGSEGKKKVCIRSYEPCKIIYDSKGKFFMELQQGVAYELRASKEGYFSQTIDVPADCNTPGDTVNLAVLLTKIEMNKPIVISDLFFDESDKMYVKKNIYFDLDKSNIRYDASLTLDKLVRLLKDNPDLVVELGAHTDSRHSSSYNLQLSQKRAESAVKYIITKGIENDRISARGYGESMLLNDCADGVECEEEKHQRNRRAEIKVLEIRTPVAHEVKPNETLYSISRRYQLSVDQLKKLNGLNDNRIYAGDKLKLK